MKTILLTMTMILATILVSTSTKGMHEFENCPMPYATQPLRDIDFSALPPGIRKKLQESPSNTLLEEITHPGVLKQIAKIYPQVVIQSWRNDPDKLEHFLRKKDREALSQALQEGWSGCFEQPISLTGVLESQVETWPVSPRVTHLLRLQDGRRYRVNGVPPWAKGNVKTTVTGFAFGGGHDIKVGKKSNDDADFAQEGSSEVAEATVWNPTLQPQTPTIGPTKIKLIGFTHSRSLRNPTIASLNAKAAAVEAGARRLSDPDGTGPMAPMWTPIVTVHPMIFDIGDVGDFCNYPEIYERVKNLYNWIPTEAGEAIYPEGDFINAGCGFVGLGGLCERYLEGQNILVSYIMGDTIADPCTIIHEWLHSRCGMHEEGQANCIADLPGLDQVCGVQPYGWIGPLGNTGICAPISPSLRVETLKWVVPGMVHEVQPPEKVTINYIESPDMSKPKILRLQRSSRDSDWLYFYKLGKSVNVPIGMQSGISPMWRTGNRWLEPVAVNCKEATGHVRSTCSVNQTLVEDITGTRLTLVAETQDTATEDFVPGVPPPTIPTTTTTSTIPPRHLVVGVGWDGSIQVGVPDKFTCRIKWSDDPDFQNCPAVRWIQPVNTTVNPLTYTPTSPGWLTLNFQGWLDGVWSDSKTIQLPVNVGSTTTTSTTVVSTTTSSSTSSSSSSTTTSVSTTTPPTIVTTTTISSPLVGAISGPNQLQEGQRGTWTFTATRDGSPYDLQNKCWWSSEQVTMDVSEATMPCTISSSMPSGINWLHGWGWDRELQRWSDEVLLVVRVSQGSTTTSMVSSTSTSSSSTTSTSTSSTTTVTSKFQKCLDDAIKQLNHCLEMEN